MYNSVDPTAVIPVTNLSSCLTDSRSTYMCAPTYINDEEWIECPTQLREFMNNSIDRLGQVEKLRIRNSFSHSDYSFFCINNLNLPKDKLVRVFYSTKASDRIESCLSYIEGRNPSRHSLRLPSNDSIFNSPYILLVVIALFVVLVWQRAL